MWILESDGDIFGGRRLWLRPGKRYLFGRTAVEAGCFVIQEKTISRKHLTIQVAEVTENEGFNLRTRSTVTIEDLKTKIGTWVNDKSIKGERFDLIKDNNEIKLGHYRGTFRISWQPVVLSFSFTKSELRNDPWAHIRQNLEPIDIKFLADYDYTNTTHVVSKKRNTSKVLQALINGKYIVYEAFLEAVIEAATPKPDVNGTETSALEEDFDGNWPDAMQYLPPRSDAPGNDQPDDTFRPNERRREIFDGYTFVFYEEKRYQDLSPAITSGKGKALLNKVVPGETDINDFIRYVKEIAGEKGLGEFEDGSEGKGVVVVRYLPPPDDEHGDWFLDFYNQVALRLDHRPIEPRDFLSAILDIEPAQLRRPLEFDPAQPKPAESQQARWSGGVDTGLAKEFDQDQNRPELTGESPPPPPRTRRRERRAPKSRFRGFDVDVEEDEEQQPASATAPGTAAEASQGMFMTQQEDGLTLTGRKRPLPELDRDIMEDVAPTAAAIKRRRLERGEEPVPPRETTPPAVALDEDMSESPPPQAKGKGKGKGKVITAAAPKRGRKGGPSDPDDILDLAIRHREEEDAAAQTERDRLERELRDGEVNYEAIRRLTIVEPMEIRRSAQNQRSREQDIEEGRWDPRWNGRKNFKRFRKQGEPAGRPQQRVIMSLEPVRMKDYGIGDDYWLEGGTITQSRKIGKTQARIQSQATENGKGREAYAIGSDDSDDGLGEDGNGGDDESVPEVMDIEATHSRSRKGKAAELASSKQSQAARSLPTRGSKLASGSKRAAAEPPAKEKPAKKRSTRSKRQVEASDEEEESDDGLNFKFGKRR
ncbi:Nibrin [Cytospora mali]|uniref:Nibrin n=1 Tax=Cytospora mali TaxID=578113 RepID=A0A194UVY2_CYTMA|nr:Nibrin [Valsa mali var. pyri (nom. inval.)]